MALTTGSRGEDRTLHFKAKLRDRADQLREEIRSTLARSNDESHVRISELARDEGDDSFSDLIVDLNLSDIDRDAQELRRIDAALLRLKEGTFGRCVDCDQPIPVARLEAEPTAVRCIGCQERYEKTHATQSTPTL
jgi:RNA polymerase-binding protein DksA